MELISNVRSEEQARKVIKSYGFEVLFSSVAGDNVINLYSDTNTVIAALDSNSTDMVIFTNTEEKE